MTGTVHTGAILVDGLGVGKGGEFENDPDFSPYYGEGIIALDACTAFSKKVNCIVIDDEADFNVTTENER